MRTTPEKIAEWKSLVPKLNDDSVDHMDVAHSADMAPQHTVNFRHAKNAHEAAWAINSLIADLEEAQEQLASPFMDGYEAAKEEHRPQIIALEAELAATRKKLAESERRYSESVGGFKRDLQQKLDDQRSKSVRLKAKLAEAQSRDGSIAPVAAIKFSLKTDCGDQFLRCWVEGSFDAIRSEWPEAPEAVFIGADPLHPNTQQTSTASLDAAIAEAITEGRAKRLEALREWIAATGAISTEGSWYFELESIVAGDSE